ncbi:MAG: hypothetical protein V1717_01920 [Candidatus Micrarchaeota archaeon]
MADVGATEVQQIGATVSGQQAGGLPQRTFLPLYIKKNAPPFMKQHKRYDYIAEYVGYEKDRYKNTLKAVFCLAGGVLTLNAFAPGALLMFALAARFQDIAWMDGFINKTFGKYRSLVIVD